MQARRTGTTDEASPISRPLPVERVTLENHHVHTLQFGTHSAPKGNGDARFDLNHEAREEITKVVQRVFVFPEFSAPRVVVFSSIDKASSSSEMCFHTARVLTTTLAGTVCLMDANSQAPLLHKLSGVDKNPGLSKAIDSRDPIKDFAVRLPGGNLWLLPAGSIEDLRSQLLLEGFRRRLTELRKEFDYILIDAPPVLAAASTVLLGRMADGVILVVDANSTRRENARRAKETFESAGVKLIGAILNNTLPDVAFAL